MEEYSQINILIPKGLKKELKRYLVEKEQSITDFLINLIDKEIRKNESKDQL